MRTGGRVGAWLAGAAVAVAGCHTPAPAPQPIFPSPPAPPTLPATQPGSLEPDYAGLPTADPAADAVPPAAPPGTPYRELTEAACRDLAAAHSPEAGLILRGNQAPTPPPAGHHKVRRSSPAICDDLTRDLRELAAADARNTAAADALEQFYRLAEVEGRAELLRSIPPLLDDLRATVKTARAEGVRVPTEPADLDRQRGQLLALVGQADLGSALLNTDLKRRIGLDGQDPGRLWPTGPFPMTAAPVDAEAAVRVALQRRPDLQLLRTAYLRLDELRNAECGVRNQNQDETGLRQLAAFIPQSAIRNPQSIAVYRQQLHDLTAAKERAAADEVRAATATLNAQTRQVGLARWRADQLTAQVETAKKNGPLAELPARIEAIRARAEVVAAVFAWQQARVKLLAAQGAFAGSP